MTSVERINVSDGARRRWWRTGVSVAALLLAIQSITITLPIHGRVVDEASGKPVAGAAIAALWQFDAWTPVHGLPGGTVKIAQAVTDEEGVFRFPAAFILHPPLLPLSWLMRSDTDMPGLVVVADGYQPQWGANDVFGINGPRHASGFLSVRTSSLQGAVLRLPPLPAVLDARQLNQYRDGLGWTANQIGFAAGSCARRVYCQSHSLADVRRAIKRGTARARSSQAADAAQR